MYGNKVLLGAENRKVSIIQSLCLKQNERIELFFIDTNFSVTISDYNIQLNARVLNLKRNIANIKLTRGDSICLKRQDNYLIIQQRVDGDFFDLGIVNVGTRPDSEDVTEKDETSNFREQETEQNDTQSVQEQNVGSDTDIKIILTGQMLIKYNEGFSAFNDLCELLYARTWLPNCLSVWEGGIAIKELIQEAGPQELYVILEVLAMSPWNPELCYTKAAFQNHGFHGLVRYHQRQVFLALELLRSVSYEQLIELLNQIITNAKIVQCGIAAQIFRALLLFYHFDVLKTQKFPEFTEKKRFLITHDFTNQQKEMETQTQEVDADTLAFLEFGGKIEETQQKENSDAQNIYNDKLIEILCGVTPINPEKQSQWCDMSLCNDCINYSVYNKSQLLILIAIYQLLKHQVVFESTIRFKGQLIRESESSYVSWYMRAYHRAYNIEYQGSTILKIMQEDLIMFSDYVAQLIAYNFYLEAPKVSFLAPTAAYCALNNIQSNSQQVMQIRNLLTGELTLKDEILLLNWIESMEPVSILIAAFLFEKFSEQTKKKMCFIFATVQKSFRALKRASDEFNRYNFFKNSFTGFRIDGLGYLDEPPAQLSRLNGFTDVTEDTKDNKPLNYVKIWRIYELQNIVKVQFQLKTAAEPYIDVALYKQYENEKSALNIEFFDSNCSICTDFIEEIKINEEKYTYEESDSSSNSSENNQCYICLKSKEKFVKLGCSHMLCSECFAQYNIQCALCRAPVMSFSIDDESFEIPSEISSGKLQGLQKYSQSISEFDIIYNQPFEGIEKSIVRSKLLTLQRLERMLRFMRNNQLEENIINNFVINDNDVVIQVGEQNEDEDDPLEQEEIRFHRGVIDEFDIDELDAQLALWDEQEPEDTSDVTEENDEIETESDINDND